LDNIVLAAEVEHAMPLVVVMEVAMAVADSPKQVQVQLAVLVEQKAAAMARHTLVLVNQKPVMLQHSMALAVAVEPILPAQVARAIKVLRMCLYQHNHNIYFI
jgi:hypothetical protein